jgi:hypothetical protein
MAFDEDAPIEPLALIEHIRRYEFGIGADLQGDGREVVNRLVRKYRHLLETVAQDLNSKESHFLLELVQNADDNHYADGVSPALTFRLHANELVVSNNELGFAPKNVKALCSAGESSKRNKAGYIGEKGIGFKSVFKVTDRPEIHSNGYHFRFDLTNPDDPLGYVVPHWVPARPDAIEGLTTVVLPAKAGYAFPRTLLNDINATLLLFLEKLRLLEVHESGGSVRYDRVDSGGLSTLTVAITPSGAAGTTTTTNYLRAKLRQDMSAIVETKREKILAADVVLAFPMSAERGALPLKGCQTYAFLPIREFGFTFYIQADFVLISSREGIHEELPWNVRLRDSIAPAFAGAVEEFKAHPALAMSYLRFLPAEAEIVDPFFRPVVEQTIACLQEVACIPAEGGGWKRPAEILVAPAAVRKLFTSADVLTLFGADYPAHGFVAPEGSLSRLSCRTLLVDDLLDVFRQHGDWLKAHDLDWRIRFYEYLATSVSRTQYVAGLQTAPCIPTADGSLATPEGCTIFCPLSSSEDYGFEHLLTVVDQSFYVRAVEIAPDIITLLRDLGVKRDEPYELIQNHLLPLHTAGHLSKAGAKPLIGHIRYLRDKLEAYVSKGMENETEASVISALRENLYLASQREEDGVIYFERPGDLYITNAYRPSFAIDKQLGDGIAPKLLLSAAYIVHPGSPQTDDVIADDLRLWREFFARLGVNEAPRVVRHTSGNVSCSNELTALLSSDKQPVRRATLECLNSNWHLYCTFSTYLLKVGRSYQYVSTTFADSLRKTIAPTKRRVTVPLTQTFHDRSEVRDILGEDLVFVDADLWDERFLAECGVTYRVNAEGCLKRLRQLRTEGRAPREQLRQIYRQLEKLWTSERTAIDRAFRSEPLIAVGRGEALAWVRPNAACWRPSNLRLLDSRHPPLRETYVDFSTFFTAHLQVPLDLELDKWVDALVHLDSLGTTSEREATAVSIYRRLSQRLASTGSGNLPLQLPGWVPRLQVEAIYLTTDGNLVVRSPQLFFNDAPQYATLFHDVPDVTFLALAPEQHSAVSQLLTHAGIQTLSSALSIDVAESTTGIPDDQLMQKLREMLMCIARVVYGQSLDRFQTAINEKLFEALRDLEVLIVPNLELDVTLGDAVRKTDGALAWRGNQLLVDAGATSRLDRVALEVRKLLRLPPFLADIISRVLISSTARDAEAYLQLRNISALPPEEAEALASALGLALPPPPAPEPAVEPELHPEPESENLRQPASPTTAPVQSEPARDEVDTPAAAAAPAVSAPTPTTEVAQPVPVHGSVVSAESVHLATTPIQPFEIRDQPATPTGWGLGTNPVWPPSGGLPLAPANPVVRQHLSQASPPGEQFPQVDPSSPTMPPQLPAASGVFTPARIGWSTGGSSRPWRRSRGLSPARSKRGRLLSYADAPDPSRDQLSNPEPDPEAAERRKAIEIAAVQHFLDKAASQWKSIEVMPPNNPGYDIRAVALDGGEEYIEVKGQGGAWTEEGVALTSKELAKANAARDRYWLAVVEFAMVENRRQLYLVKDPFGLTTQFRFDNGWKGAAQIIAALPKRPEVGMFVLIPELGKGRITKIKGTGLLAKLHIELEDGRQSFSKIFNPATMTLSYE